MGKQVTYIRVSTQRQGASGLGLDAQKHAVETFARSSGHTAEFMPPAVTFPNGCHMVEIDPGTGVVKIARYSIVEDIGNVLNPTLAHGQIQGGVAMGIGQAL